MSSVVLNKTQRIDIRTNHSVKQLLQEAARSCHKSVSEFLLDAGITAANQALADRRHFTLSDADWDAFEKVLDRPIQSKARLNKLLNDASALDS